jgi:hypothetical protein
MKKKTQRSHTSQQQQEPGKRREGRGATQYRVMRWMNRRVQSCSFVQHTSQQKEQPRKKKTRTQYRAVWIGWMDGWMDERRQGGADAKTPSVLFVYTSTKEKGRGGGERDRRGRGQGTKDDQPADNSSIYHPPHHSQVGGGR